jgi:hypothetical protein
MERPHRPLVNTAAVSGGARSRAKEFYHFKVFKKSHPTRFFSFFYGGIFVGRKMPGL